jgi:putative transcriptional regulator
MDKALFDELLESVRQAGEIVRGERAPSREFYIDPLQIKQVREQTGLSQAQFARLIHVSKATLVNWEQGRRVPSGPARALLTAIRNDPVHVLRAVQADEHRAA